MVYVAYALRLRYLYSERALTCHILSRQKKPRFFGHKKCANHDFWKSAFPSELDKGEGLQ